MIRYTTPTINLSVHGIDLTGKEVYVTLEQDALKMTKSGEDLTLSVEVIEEVPVTGIAFTMSQEESAKFAYNKCVSVQANWISSDGVRNATSIKTIKVMRNLLDSVIEYGN